MTVGRLIQLLESYEPETEVLLMSQPEWPFEYSISGVCQRDDFAELEDCNGEKKAGNVFILEGSQLRYGNKDAWECARR